MYQGIAMKDVRIINFIDLNISQKKRVLQWRNHASVREWMLNHEPIPLENHLNFIESLRHSTTDRYFMVVKQEDEIGVFYLNHIAGGQCEIGLYANPYNHIQGAGTLLLNVALSHAFKTLGLERVCLEVLDNNKRAIGLYTKFHFQKTGTHQHKEQVLLTMELTREHWQF